MNRDTVVITPELVRTAFLEELWSHTNSSRGGAAAIDETRTLEDLGLDSLDAIEFTMDLERRFSCEIADEDVPSLALTVSANIHRLTKVLAA